MTLNRWVMEAQVASFKRRWGVLGALALSCVACGSGSSLSESQAARGSVPDSNWLDGHDPQAVLASDQCLTPQPGDAPLRRLSNLEYKNTLLDLGFDPELVESSVAILPSEPESLGFRNGARALTVTSLLAQKYGTIAEQLAASYAYPCDADESSCADQMIHHAGGRTHRRPLSVDEKASYRALYDRARVVSSHDDSLGWVVRAMLQSPHFLYRVEIPHALVSRPVTGYEMANRLSYMLWQSPPDAELRAAVAAGELETPEQVRAQALRMLKDPRAENLVEFFEQWLDLDELHDIERDPELYPGISPQLARLFRAEARAFLLHLMRQPGASLQELLSAEYTFANAELAEHYGLEGPRSSAFELVDAPGRRGILTQGMLAVADGPTRSSIVRRGLKIRTDFLCQIVPAPPDTVDLTLDGLGEDLSQAERLAQHREEPSCANCHSLMDPIGELFEGFDAVGRARTHDEFGGQVFNDGALTKTIDADGPLSGVAELAERLAGSQQAQQCYLIQNMRYFLGREVTAADHCSQAQLTEYWRDRDFSLVELLIGLTQTDAFLYKPKKQAGPDEGEATGSEP